MSTGGKMTHTQARLTAWLIAFVAFAVLLAMIALGDGAAAEYTVEASYCGRNGGCKWY